MKIFHVWLVLLLVGVTAAASDAAERRPNVVYIMSDELAYFELSHMGNPHIRTPRIDRMAAEGLRFTQALAGAPVCAPLRCGLMTGKHMGHASVRANDGGTPLRADEVTIATLLKRQGYATGGFGKWGCGGRGSTGVPEKHGFDIFFGYYDQVHAHSFYPPYLVRNSEEVPLAGNAGGRSGQTYSHYNIMEEGLQFIRDNKDRPFFCYLPITPPHGMYDIPADDPAWAQYRDDAWIKDESIPQDVKNYAAMVTMVDNNVGQVLDLLDELELTDNTIVFFTGDNGGQDRFRSDEHPRGFFGPNVNPQTGVEFRGGKGNLYEGGLRIPFIVHWPGKVAAGQVSDLLFYQPDVYPTLAELADATPPSDIDGISILPEILGEESVGRPQRQHELLYWEFRNQVAVRMGDWKAIRAKRDTDWELYNLQADVSETTNVANQHPDVLRQMQVFAAESHQPVKKGTYADRTLHERDRWAKWGTSREQNSRPKRRTTSSKQSPLRVRPVPGGRLSPFQASFTKYVNVFGVHVFATAATPEDKVQHAATVLAEYLDDNEDGQPDNRRVVDALASRDAYLVMAADESEIHRIDPEHWHRAGFHAGQSQWGTETDPGHGQFDASLEEVLHLITDHGYANAYPRVFGKRRGTQIAKCLDAARGGHFLDVPDRYPKSAWFTYDDTTCEYECQISEYIYWALTSILGAQDDPDRQQDIQHEWRLPTRELVKQHDPAVYKLLTNPKYRLPQVLPDGKYKVRR